MKKKTQSASTSTPLSLLPSLLLFMCIVVLLFVAFQAGRQYQARQHAIKIMQQANEVWRSAGYFNGLSDGLNAAEKDPELSLEGDVTYEPFVPDLSGAPFDWRSATPREGAAPSLAVPIP